MPDTFVDRRRKMIRDLIKQYGGNEDDASTYLAYWMKGRLRQVDVEMWIARDHGATSPELAEQFGYSSAEHALGALNTAKKKVERG